MPQPPLSTTSTADVSPRRGEIWRVDLGGGKDHWAVVVSLNERNEKLDTVVVVPFSSLGRQSPTVIQFEPGESGLPQTSFLKAHLISTINKRQFRRIHPRRLSGARMKQLVRSIVCAIDPDALSYQL